MVLEPWGPLPLYIAQRDGGPPTTVRLGAPDQGAESRPDLAFGPDSREIKPTLRSCGEDDGTRAVVALVRLHEIDLAALFQAN